MNILLDTSSRIVARAFILIWSTELLKLFKQRHKAVLQGERVAN